MSSIARSSRQRAGDPAWTCQHPADQTSPRTHDPPGSFCTAPPPPAANEATTAHIAEPAGRVSLVVRRSRRVRPGGCCSRRVRIGLARRRLWPRLEHTPQSAPSCPPRASQCQHPPHCSFQSSRSSAVAVSRACSVETHREWTTCRRHQPAGAEPRQPATPTRPRHPAEIGTVSDLEVGTLVGSIPSSGMKDNSASPLTQTISCAVHGRRSTAPRPPVSVRSAGLGAPGQRCPCLPSHAPAHGPRRRASPGRSARRDRALQTRSRHECDSARGAGHPLVSWSRIIRRWPVGNGKSTQRLRYSSSPSSSSTAGAVRDGRGHLSERLARLEDSDANLIRFAGVHVPECQHAKAHGQACAIEDPADTHRSSS